MSTIARKTSLSALGAASAALISSLFVTAPAQAKVYECWNPAICIAVCGKPVCGSNLKAAGSQTGSLKRLSGSRGTLVQQTPRTGRPQ